MPQKTRRSRRSPNPVGTGQGIMYGLCKVYKDIVDASLRFGPILSIIIAPIYKSAKFLVPFLKCEGPVCL